MPGAIQSNMTGSGFGVEGFGFRAWGSEFKAQVFL